MALGIVAGYSAFGESHHAVLYPGRFNEEVTRFVRGSPAVRWDFQQSRSFRAWLGAETGLLLTIETGVGPDDFATRRTRVLPCVSSAAELGIAGNVGPVSMGGVVRGLYGSMVSERSLPPDGVFVGLIFGAHIPIGAPIPR